MEDGMMACEYREPSIFARAVALARRLFEKKPESNYITHAKREFLAAGYKPLDEEEDGPNKWIQENILELLQVFAKQGHSGFSAHYCIDMFAKLAAFKPIGPLSGDDAEWVDVAEQNGGPLYQNRRASHVFKDPKGAYDIDAVVFEEADGCRFTGRFSRQPVTFPYEPRRVVVKIDQGYSDAELERLASEAWNRGAAA